MKILFITPYPKSIAPSQRFRFEQYLEAIEKKGWAYDYASFIDLPTWQILHKPQRFVQKAGGMLRAFHRRLLLMFRLRQYDYVFIHREASHIGPPIFEWMISKVLHKKIIYDFDDAIWLPNYSSHNKLFHRLKYYRKVHSIFKMSHKISAGNRYLASFAAKANKQVIVNPTTIDTENYHNCIKNQSTQKIIIGWTGTLTTIRYLYPLLPIIQKLEHKYDFEFHVIANENPLFDLKSFRFIPWKKETEIDDLLQFNIGLMPLEDDKWAKGKCGFKALQYMSLGIPAIVSPVGVNTEIIDEGINGFICNSEAAWLSALEMLLESPEKRWEMGKAAREKIVNHYSVQSNTNNFLGLFEN